MPNARKNLCYSYANCQEEIKNLLREIVENFRKIFTRENLVGVYLHGSLAMGCFSPGKSDIDIIIVVKRSLSDKEKEALAKLCLSYSKQIGGKGLEMSVILEKNAKNPVYSMPYEFHFSESWREKFESGIIGPFPSVDPDLPAHLRVIYERGVVLYGKFIREVFGKVPDGVYFKALLYDLEDVPELLVKHPSYYILNLCRTLGFLKTGKVMSKREGGEWYIQNEHPFSHLVRKALKCSFTKVEVDFKREKLEEFAEFMLKEIDKEKRKRFGG